MAVLNLDASEPYIAANASDDGSVLFASAPIYARIKTRKSSSKANLPLLVGAPVAVIAIGALTWGLMSRPAQAPTTAETAPPAQMAQVTPTPLPETPAPAAMSTPAPAAATPAPVQVARAETLQRAAPVRRAAPARRVTPQTAPDASSASSNVSATVPAPVAAPPAAPVVIAAPAAPAAAPAPAPAATTPEAPM